MVLFDENGGTGEMESVTVEYKDGYKLPENGYTPPEGMTFAGWLVGDYTLEPGDIIMVYDDTLVMAQWQSEAAEPVAEEPVEEIPTEETPTEETPAEETPVEEIPVEGTPIEETPTEETPTEETPVEETPIEETPVEETPVEETPTEETPIEEPATEETPVEETPVEESEPVEEAVEEPEPVEEPAPVQTWMVLFYENGGEDNMEGATIEDQGAYTLPENGYAAPEGASFAGWQVGDEVYQPGDTVTIGEEYGHHGPVAV